VEVVISLLEHMRDTRGKDFTFKSAEKRAVELAENGIRTAEDAAHYLQLDVMVQRGSKEVLKRMGQYRNPTDDEQALYAKVKATYLARTKTGCTGCEYCQPCPMGVKIPRIFRGYDNAMLYAEPSFKGGYARIVQDNADFSHCIACRKCERACPQHLPIVQYLSEIHEACKPE
jgi:predicted aldo/keto reductase-like oxidoreductase